MKLRVAEPRQCSMGLFYISLFLLSRSVYIFTTAPPLVNLQSSPAAMPSRFPFSDRVHKKDTLERGETLV